VLYHLANTLQEARQLLPCYRGRYCSPLCRVFLLKWKVLIGMKALWDENQFIKP